MIQQLQYNTHLILNSTYKLSIHFFIIFLIYLNFYSCSTQIIECAPPGTGCSLPIGETGTESAYIEAKLPYESKSMETKMEEGGIIDNATRAEKKAERLRELSNSSSRRDDIRQFEQEMTRIVNQRLENQDNAPQHNIIRKWSIKCYHNPGEYTLKGVVVLGIGALGSWLISLIP